MKKQAFSSEKYLNLQRDHIIERINQFDGKLYLEFGGKMLEDFHAARVLPGYEPDNKIKLLQELRDQVEIVIAINANNIEHSKARGDLGISYDQEVLRLIDKFNELGIYVGSVVITQYAGQAAADADPVRPFFAGYPDGRTQRHSVGPGFSAKRVSGQTDLYHRQPGLCHRWLQGQSR